MEIHDLDGSFKNEKECGIALGNFDGIHIGHMALIDKVVAISKYKNFCPSVLLFKEHTRPNTKLITNLKQKEKILNELGIERVFLRSFDKNFMSLSAEDFVYSFLSDMLNIKLIVVGFDYRFGYKASGDVKKLMRLAEERDIEVIVENIVEIGGKAVSSSDIRQMIKGGNIEGANRLLYKNYALMGRVVDGNKRGRTMGFPTANIEITDNFVIPKFGVYLTEVNYKDKLYKSITNVGTNPTFKADDNVRVEAFIIDFSQDIYGEEIEISFIERIRDEIKFDSKEALIEQMNKDVEIAMKKP
ncbi:MAG: bifunctional riboflavin kinase/FAD synthetase [Tissierellia bacterium]|nr:bifunctional riboflavin kinase/FAD synthetase [Tissierellia bacterium]